MDQPKLNYTHINHLARIQLGLTMNEYAVADMIYHYANNPESPIPGWCFANKKTISEKLGLTERSVFAIITKLEAKKIVERHSQTHHLRVTSMWYRIAYTIQETPSADGHEETSNHYEETSESMRDTMKKLHTDHEDSSVGTMNNLHADYEETSYNNNSYSNKENNTEENITTTSPIGEEQFAADDVDNVVEVLEGEVVSLPNGKPRASSKRQEPNPDGSYGDPRINAVQARFLEVVDLEREDCTQRESRMYAKKLLDEVKRGDPG